MALLTGMTPDGQEVPVQVDSSGRLVAEGLTGPKGDQGGPGQLAGSAAAPSITPPNDPNTGIYSPGADQVAISTGGSGRLFVDASGVVRQGSIASETGLVPLGIVTSTNTAAGANFLAIKSADATNGANIQISRSRGTNAAPTALLPGDAVGTVVFNSYVGTAYLATANIGCTTTAVSGSNHSTALTFTTTDVGVVSEKLRITSAGLVGIGTSSPQVLLDVWGSATTAYSSSATTAKGTVRFNNNADGGYGSIILNALNGSIGGVAQNCQASINCVPEGLNTRNTSLTFGVRRASDGHAPEAARIDSSGRLLVGTDTAPDGAPGGSVAASGGLYLQSPNGNWWLLRVSDAGALSAVAV